MAKRPAVRSQKLKTYSNKLASSPRTATSPPRRPAAGGSRKTTGAGGLGFAPLTSTALSSGALSRGRGGVRKAAGTRAASDRRQKAKDWIRAAGTTARKPASAASKTKWGRMSTAAKALGSPRPASAKRINREKAAAKARPSGRNAETAARRRGLTTREARARATSMMDRGTAPRQRRTPRRGSAIVGFG